MLTFLRPFIGLFCLISSMGYAQADLKIAYEKLENGKLKEATAIYLKYKHHPEAIEGLGDIASFNKDWETAIEYYGRLVEKDAENAMYNFKLGGAMGMKAYYGSKLQAGLMLGDIKKYLKKAADLDPKHQEARRALVELYMQIPGFLGGSQTIAESYASDLDRINEIDALLADAYIFRAIDYKKLAVSKYAEAIKLAAAKPKLISRNYLNYELGEAAALYELYPETGKKLLEDYINNYGYRDIKSKAWAYLRLAQIARNEKARDKALGFIEKSLEIDPSFDKALEEKVKIQRL